MPAGAWMSDDVCNVCGCSFREVLFWGWRTVMFQLSGFDRILSGIRYYSYIENLLGVSWDFVNACKCA